jgi:hypothetical protein
LGHIKGNAELRKAYCIAFSAAAQESPCLQKALRTACKGKSKQLAEPPAVAFFCLCAN